MVTGLRRYLALCLVLFCGSAVAATPVTLQEGEFVLDSAPAVPGADAVWAPVALPDQWRRSRPGQSGNGWYRFGFTIDLEDGEVQAVLLPRLAMNAEVYLNGVALGSGGRMTAPIARNWNRPLYFLVPPGQLREGANILHVRLASIARSQGSLFPIRVGADRELRGEYEHLIFLRVTLNQVITAFIAGIGLMMLSLWGRRRTDTMYAYFGAAALVWAFNSSNLFVTRVPVSNETWEILVNASFPVFVSLLMVSMLRFIEASKPAFERLLWLAMAAALVSLTAAPSGLFLAFTQFWHLVSLCVVITTLFWLARHAWRNRGLESALLVGSILAGFLFGLHDWLVHSKLLWYADPQQRPAGELFLVQYAAPLVFAIVGWMLSVRFVSVLNDFERLNAELEQRVELKHRELADNFRQMESLTRERAILEERERIVADIHDGLGAQLVTALRLVEARRVDGAGMAELLRDCLDDMRVVMYSLAPGDHDLDAVLGSLRHRLTPRFERAGIGMNWRLDGSLADFPLSAHAALHVQRILQECFANSLKHAGASRIEVVSGPGVEPGSRTIRIADDGKGIQLDYRGRGIANMHNRARQIGASLAIESSDQGTAVTLQLPAARVPVGTYPLNAG